MPTKIKAWKVAESKLIGDGLFSLCERSILIAQHIWPEPAVQCFLVELQNVPDKPKRV